MTTQGNLLLPSVAIRYFQRSSFGCWQRLLHWSIGVTALFVALGLAKAQPSDPPNQDAEIAAVNIEMNTAIEKVKVIINQRVGALRRMPGMKVTVYSPGWFHEGATKPDFNTVDVRATRETPYAQHPYVTSDLNPDYAFIGSQLEFNSMTKYFYTDRTVPKKKLTEAEMLEVNLLYRIIGSCEQKLRHLQPPPEPVAEPETEVTEAQPERKYEPVPKGNYVKAAVGVSLVLVLYFAYRMLRKTA
jgi:hypothetical protein